VAAVRHVAELGGTFDFDSAGNLVGVDLASDRVSLGDADIPCLVALPHLTQLKLSGAGVTNAGARQLGTMVGLSELFLLDAQIDNAGLKQLAQLTNLSTLNIRRSAQVTDGGLVALRQLPKLTNLGLLEVGITNRGPEQLQDLPQLRMLDLRGSTQVGTPGLQQLQPLKKLKTLRIGGYQINDETLAAVVKLSSLTGLTIDEAAITDAGLARLGRLPLEDLSISPTTVSDIWQRSPPSASSASVASP
jgi:hypothetical protein